mmetsp:Transcript_12812/g.28184  ORF Transcript_12812/g.28184 Transcript_12812/m.28184 type:complete len:99 (+) Transcript_12812:61-357(+)|eukprot:CAMPEP_0168738060 /NCGR_PEP_ID=MMETSP0724-20121128/10730_1 /TAXON_ID=265536 /ORGANISM="Amphiprora sp., Strain CCMP467" /LENGTH=98 /DNA_ID=CAMNT_0008785375 /DNA_START=63 /DNA_END=359 /DNA_ORIENTATION=+
MKSTVAALVLLASGASAFAPAPPTSSSSSSSQLGMGLLDAFAPKPKPPSAPQEGGGGFLSGRGKKITIREDEDNAMWIEDDKTGEAKSAKGGFFGKGK